MFSGMAYIWLGASIALIIIEAIVPGLISIWFAAGALSALIATLLHAPLWLQVSFFVLVSVISLIFTRPLIKKYINEKTQPTNADAVIGKECIVTSTVDNVLGHGSVKAGGKDWTARSYSDDVTIDIGTRATVERIEGVKLIIKPKE